MMKEVTSFVFAFVLWAFVVHASPGEALVRRVYQKLTEVGGGQGNGLPRIELSGRAYSVAGYRRASNTIFIEQQALDACLRFGAEAESALAFLIGHELTHFYQDHHWAESDGVTGFVVASSTFEAHTSEEEEADLYGAFLSYLAGYQTTELVPRLLDALYASYGLSPEASGNYPSLAGRKQVAAGVAKKAEELILIHKTGAYLLALGRYPEAVSCFQYINQFVRCKEGYNNLGIAQLKAAYCGSGMSRQGYRYPLLADPELVLRAASEQQRVALLNAAIRNFKVSLDFSPGLIEAHIHLAAAYSMLGNADSVRYWAGRLERNKPEGSGKAYASILLGLDAARQGRRAVAEEQFLKAKILANGPVLQLLVSHNLLVVRGQSPPLQRMASATFIEDQIDGLHLIGTFPAMIRQKERVPLQGGLVLSYLSRDDSNLFFLERGGGLLKLHLTTGQKWQSSLGLGVGDILDGARFPQVDITPAANGAFGLIREKGLVFQLDEQGVIREWGIFMM